MPPPGAALGSGVIDLKIVFMGTPQIAVPSLQALIEAGHEILAVVTQPDRPKGRGNRMAMPEVKLAAIAAGIPVFQPASLRREHFADVLAPLHPDVIVVMAFGQILPKEILELPQYGCINVHASLLPKYRGCAPIQQAILDGEKTTGVTIMHMAEGLDTGDMILQRSTEIRPSETAGELSDDLAALGAELLCEALRQVEAGTAPRIPQPEAGASYAKKIEKEDGRLDFSEEPEALVRRIHAFAPHPGAFTTLDGKLLKIWDAGVETQQSQQVFCGGNRPGMILALSKDAMLVSAGHGVLAVTVVGPEGKKPMDVAAWGRGFRIPTGHILGGE